MIGKASSKKEPGALNPGPLKRNTFAPYSVASFRPVCAAHCVFAGYNGLLLVLSQLLLFLLGIPDVMPCGCSRIKPLQEICRLSATLLRQVNHGISGGFSPVRWK